MIALPKDTYGGKGFIMTVELTYVRRCYSETYKLINLFVNFCLYREWMKQQYLDIF